MKTNLLLFISIISINLATAQHFKYVPKANENTPAWAELMYSANANVYEVEQLRAAYYQNHNYQKTIHEQNYKHWRTLSEPLLDSRGNIHPEREFTNAGRAGGGAANWSPVGPMETYSLGNEGSIPVSWQCNIYCFDPIAS